MIIKTLNDEKFEQIENIRQQYEYKMNYYVQAEKKLSEDLADAKDSLHKLSIELEEESVKRAELEQELNQRGNGYEEEVTLRLHYEGRLNRLYAQYRGLMTTLENLHEDIKSYKTQVDEKVDVINLQRREIYDLNFKNQELDRNLKESEEKQRHIKNVNARLDQKLNAAYDQNEDLKETGSKLKQQIVSLKTEIAAKDYEIEHLQHEIKHKTEEASTTKSLYENVKVESEKNYKMMKEIEISFSSYKARNSYYEQEYFRLKEIEESVRNEWEQLKLKHDSVQQALLESDHKKDTYYIELSEKIHDFEETRAQLKFSCDKVDELSRNRRILEEKIANQKGIIEEHEKSLQVYQDELKASREECEGLKMKIIDLEADINILEIKRDSDIKQHETNRDAYIEKVYKVTELLNVEQGLRERWINKFETEVKNHAETRETANKLANEKEDMEIQNKTMSSKLGEVAKKVSNLESELSKANINNSLLQAKIMEAQRNIATLKLIMNRAGEEYKKKERYANDEISNFKEEVQQELRNIEMRCEEVWQQAHSNLLKFQQMQVENVSLNEVLNSKDKQISRYLKTIDWLRGEYERKACLFEQASCNIETLTKLYNDKSANCEELTSELSNAFKQISILKSKIPPDLMHLDKPYMKLQRRIKDLECMLDGTIIPDKEDFSQMYIYFEPKLDAFAQTDLGMGLFDKIAKSGVSSSNFKLSKPNTPGTNRSRGSVRLDSKSFFGFDEAAMELLENEPLGSMRSGDLRKSREGNRRNIKSSSPHDSVIEEKGIRINPNDDIRTILAKTPNKYIQKVRDKALENITGATPSGIKRQIRPDSSMDESLLKSGRETRTPFDKRHTVRQTPDEFMYHAFSHAYHNGLIPEELIFEAFRKGIRTGKIPEDVLTSHKNHDIKEQPILEQRSSSPPANPQSRVGAPDGIFVDTRNNQKSGHRLSDDSQEGSVLSPVNLRSVYHPPIITIRPSSCIEYEGLPRVKVSRKAPATTTHFREATTIPEIKRFINQANSRKKNNFNFM
jgi:chromosome segregation ATPase